MKIYTNADDLPKDIIEYLKSWSILEWMTLISENTYKKLVLLEDYEELGVYWAKRGDSHAINVNNANQNMLEAVREGFITYREFGEFVAEKGGWDDFENFYLDDEKFLCVEY